MEITGTLVLAADTVLLPVEELSDELRRQVQATEGDYAVTRPNSRTSARIVDGDGARLLEEFRQPTTVVQAVIRFCSATRENPESTLDAAFPLLERFVRARFLVPVDSPQTQSVRSALKIGSRFAGAEVVECLQTLEDTDVYRVKTAKDEIAALKLMHPEAGPKVDRMFQREAIILRYLDATVTPALLATDTENGLRFLLLSWCDGSDCATVAARLRSSGDHAALLRLSIAILDAYAHLHAQNVIHSDVHPQNILVDSDCSVHLVDFGLARVDEVEDEFNHNQRGGVGYFFEPEYANAARSNARPPCSSMLGEQYSLAALLHLLITGKQYVDFSLEREDMLRQIAEDGPLSFRARGVKPWPAVESVLAKALAKEPTERFTSVAAFAMALGSVGELPAADVLSDHGPVSYPTALKTLSRILKRLDSSAPLLQAGLTCAPTGSISYGSAGVACALHRIACARQDPKLLSLADVWGERATRDASLDNAWYCSDIEITPESVGRISPYHTESGTHFTKALIAHSMGDVTTQRNGVNGFVAASLAPCDHLDLTLGRSGTLLAASHLLAALDHDSTVDVAVLRELGTTTLAQLWQRLDSYAAILECRQIRYSGIAHGWAGILYATLCWSRASGADLPSNIGERLNQLAGLARRSGRQVCWSSIVASDTSGVRGPLMGGWCNGTAGQVHLWLAAYSALKEDQFLMLADEAGWHAAETDAPDGSLCCGLSGQAYALLALYRHSNDRAWLYRAQSLAEKAAVAYQDSRVGGGPYATARPDSLYKGELGVAVLAADLENPYASAMPAFELIDF
jgi:eukaryotic-like serine/threonine-protein kinase